MRVIVADDQPEVISALKLLLEEGPDIQVVGEASSSAGLISQVHAGRTDGIDLILLDWELPGMKSKDLISLLRDLHPQISIIALSSRPQMRKAALIAGASDFVCKSDPPEVLLAALEKCNGNKG